jgi:hypothetical protein
MSRLLVKNSILSFCFVLCACALHAQKKEYAKWAEDAFVQGDFISAANSYQKLFELDSTNIAVAFKLAESYRGYKAFKKAYSYYELVNVSAQRANYSEALYWMAMINKMLENYALSEKQLATYLKEAKNKSSFYYVSAVQELKVAKEIPLIIKDSVNCTVFPVSTLNTTHAEFSAQLHNDSTLLFSAMRPKEKVYAIDVYEAQVKDSVWQNEVLYSVLKKEKGNAANITFNKDKSRFIFADCDEKQMCVLKECVRTDSSWTNPKPLGDQINLMGFNNTHPHWASIADKEILFFTSNRTSGKGKLDIWYSELKNGEFSTAKNAGSSINTPGDEITPFYSIADSALYFSSDWHAGVGGTDIFYSKGNINSFAAPKNAGVPINSSRNDQYFYIDEQGKGFLSSLRVGTLSDNEDAICCADLYTFSKHKKVVLPNDTLPYKLIEAYVELPLVLYFHNDEPNPRTRDTLTKYTYMETYAAYKKLQPDYLTKYPEVLEGQQKQLAADEVQYFFDNHVDLGVENLHKFTTELIGYLEQGYSAEVLIKGFASPLTTSSYNVNLSLRRISSLMNYLKVYQGGVYVPYFNGTAANGAKLSFIKNPNGEYKSATGVSDDYYDVRNSIYNPRAAIERRIEVVRVNLIPKEPKEIAYFDNFRKMEIDLDTISGDKVSHKIYLKNTSKESWTVESIGADCSCTQLKWDKQVVQSGDYLVLDFTIDLTAKKGEKHNIISLKKSNNKEYQAIELKYFVQ